MTFIRENIPMGMWHYVLILTSPILVRRFRKTAHIFKTRLIKNAIRTVLLFIYDHYERYRSGLGRQILFENLGFCYDSKLITLFTVNKTARINGLVVFIGRYTYQLYCTRYNSNVILPNATGRNDWIFMKQTLHFGRKRFVVYGAGFTHHVRIHYGV